MWAYKHTDELYHYGVLGMKRGVRKANEATYRNKLTAISKNKSVRGTSDAKRFKYRNQSLPKRAGKMAAVGMTQLLIGDIMSGKLSAYRSMSKPQLTKELTKKAIQLTATTTANVAIADALAKSASNRYTDGGEIAPKTKQRLLTKEDAIEMSVGIASYGVAALGGIMGIKAMQLTGRKKNEERFNSWGQNILSEKVNNVVWTSPDFNYAVIDK